MAALMPLGDPTPVRAVRLSDGLMERVDGVRGELSRSEFVRAAVEAAVGGREVYVIQQQAIEHDIVRLSLPEWA